MKTQDIAKELQERKDRSAWSRGVTAYAVDMLQQIADYYKGCTNLFILF